MFAHSRFRTQHAVKDAQDAPCCGTEFRDAPRFPQAS
jgi:hypothetical protein